MEKSINVKCQSSNVQSELSKDLGIYGFRDYLNSQFPNYEIPNDLTFCFNQ